MFTDTKTDTTELTDEEKKDRIESLFSDILTTLGLDLSQKSLSKTPHRIAKMYVDEIFSGLKKENFPNITLFDYQGEDKSSLIITKKISIHSFCEHHFLPMTGFGVVAYFPKKKIIGLSKIPRIFHYFSKRPQLQERLTSDIGRCLRFFLETENIAIFTHLKHHCVSSRGIKDISFEMDNYYLSGIFKKDLSYKKLFDEEIKKETF